MLGLEHEFVLRGANGETVDAREVLPTVPADGRRLDPGDRNAIRCAWGGVITCDGAEAEIATAPVEIAPGFTEAADAAAAAARRELSALIPGLSTVGYSTHINVEVPSRDAVEIAALFTRRLAPAAMLMMDRATSPGLLVRPRPGRLEICGEFAEGPQLRAAAAFVTGAVRACAQAVRTGDDRIRRRFPPLAPFHPVPAHERYGWYISRRSFGCDLYAKGRSASLGQISAQEFLERSWTLARDNVPDHRDADAVVSGDSPIPLEAPIGPDLPPAHPPSPYGRALEPVLRPGMRISAWMQTWDLTVLRVEISGRTLYAAVPGRDLTCFLDQLHAGAWDERFGAFAAHSSGGRALMHWSQTGHVGLYDTVGERRALLRPERDLDGDLVDGWAMYAPARDGYTAGASFGPRAGAEPAGMVSASPSGPVSPAQAASAALERPGKYPVVVAPPTWTPPPDTQPPIPPSQDPPPGGSSWWPWPVLPIIAIIAVLAAVATVVTGGGAPVVEPSASASAGPEACSEPFSDLAADLSLSCPLTQHTDPTGDGTWYERAVEADPLPSDADIVSMQASMARFTSPVIRELFGKDGYPCGRSASRAVVCGRQPFPAGPALVVAVRFASPVPLEGEHFRIMSLVIDGSPPAGGHPGSPGTDQDLYTGADLTVDLFYVPIGRNAKTWSIGASDALAIGTGDNLLETGSRIVLRGDTAIFFVPGREFRYPLPRVRALSQVSDYSFGPQRGFASADVLPGRPSRSPASMVRADAIAKATKSARPSPAPETAATFLARLERALRAGNEDALMARLHPAVLQRYAAEDCRRLLARPDPTRRFVVHGTTPEPFVWRTDGRSTTIVDAVTVDVEVTAAGRTERTQIHIAAVGKGFRFFADCGRAR